MSYVMWLVVWGGVGCGGLFNSMLNFRKGLFLIQEATFSIRFIYSRVNGPPQTRKNYARITHMCVVRVFYCVLVQGLCQPRHTPDVI